MLLREDNLHLESVFAMENLNGILNERRFAHPKF